jgi:hypothetical protein
MIPMGLVGLNSDVDLSAVLEVNGDPFSSRGGVNLDLRSGFLYCVHNPAYCGDTSIDLRRWVRERDRRLTNKGTESPARRHTAVEEGRGTAPETGNFLAAQLSEG